MLLLSTAHTTQQSNILLVVIGSYLRVGRLASFLSRLGVLVGGGRIVDHFGDVGLQQNLVGNLPVELPQFFVDFFATRIHDMLADGLANPRATPQNEGDGHRSGHDTTDGVAGSFTSTASTEGDKAANKEVNVKSGSAILADGRCSNSQALKNLTQRSAK
eukprot:GHVT01031006.1.p1 GENE.GHVT01031006.1~~GHVT01031006.1.p1  ORF type:complete len:160 (-),score=24.07 GHVT01031006.1:756-1235(-)